MTVSKFACVSVTFAGVAVLPHITSLKLSVIKNTVLASTRSTSFLDAVAKAPSTNLLPELNRDQLTVALVLCAMLVGMSAIVFRTIELNLN